MIPQWLAEEVEEYRLSLTQSPKTILDIGANIGAFSAWAARQWPEAAIFAYEPVPENARQIVEHCPKAMVHELAVRATSGCAHLRLGDMHVTGSFHELGRQTDTKIPVNCIAAASLPGAELVKIDTEGCELEIVRGLDLTQTKVLVCEYHKAKDKVDIEFSLGMRGLELVEHIPHSDEVGLLKFARPGAVQQPVAHTPEPAATPATKQNVFIAIPTYGGTPIEFSQCLLKLYAAPPCDYSMMFLPGDSLVSRARNTLTAEFLKTDCTHLLFIDSDLKFSSEQIKRLLDHNVELVAGFYPKKKEGAVEWVCNSFGNSGDGRSNLADGEPTSATRSCDLQSVRYMGTGFMLIKRSVFERMIAVYGPELGYMSDSHKRLEFDFWSVGPHRTGTDESEADCVYEPKMLAEVMAHGISEIAARRILRTRYLSEDWFFCQRWLDLGGKVWGDPLVILKHMGHATYPLQTQLKELEVGAQTAAVTDRTLH